MAEPFVEIIHDVREAEAPVPLLSTLKMVDEMEDHVILHMIHRMEPCRLFDDLGSRKCRYLMYKDDEGVHILIWKATHDSEISNYLQVKLLERTTRV